MHDAHDLLRTLTLVLGVAAVTTLVFQRLRQPVVFGYLVAGLIVGPHVPIPLVANAPIIRTLSELGVILLMFSLGLEFSLRRLLRSGWAIVMIAALETSAMLLLGDVTARLFGWGRLESAFAGAAVAISSTTIIAKAFAEHPVEERVRERVFGILVVEDLIAVVLLALLTPAAAGPAAGTPLALTILRLVGFLAAFVVLGLLIVPRLVRFAARLGRSETTLVVGIGLAFGAALWAHSIGYSVALGAFLAGSLVAESGEERAVARLVEPVRDVFAAIFFVSVGMLIDPVQIARHAGAVAAFTALVIAGKVIAVSSSAFLTGVGVRAAVQTGMSLAQIGEFSFIIAGVGLASGATSPSLYPILVAVSALTTLTTPWLIRAAAPAAAALDRRLPRPLQTFVALYGSWIESLQSRPETSADRGRVRRTLRVLAIDAGVVATLVLGAALAGDALAHRLAARMAWPPDRAHVAVAAGTLLLALPFLFGILRSSHGLAVALARRAFADPEPDRLDLAAAPRRAFVAIVQLAAVVVVAAPLLLVLQPLLPPAADLALLGVGMVVVAIVVWRTTADLQGHVKAAAEVIVTALGRQSRAPSRGEEARALERAYDLVPGLGEPIPVRIDASSPFVGQSLAGLALRGRTGATIVAISRGTDVVLVPDGHVTLAAGDVLALAGTRPAVEAARALLTGASRHGEEP